MYPCTISQGCKPLHLRELRSGESWRDPFPMYKALRDHDPVHHVEGADFYVLTRFDDVLDADGEPSTFSFAAGRYAGGHYVRRHISLPWSVS